jgi:catechol 2,3-dioxygenase-like lactoylglutathione lyase family enzyme
MVKKEKSVRLDKVRTVDEKLDEQLEQTFPASDPLKITRCDPDQQITRAPYKPRLVGINHVALEVADVEKALSFYRAIFRFELRGSHRDEQGRMTMAFIDLGDQFLAIGEGRRQTPDVTRHFGLVVDNRSKVRELAEAAGATMIDGPFLDFLDPWGNRLQIVQYRDVQFTKSEAILKALDVPPDKSKKVRAELERKDIPMAQPSHSEAEGLPTR